MNLRPMLWTVASVMVGGLLGCGQQPKYYRVAIDQGPLRSLPSSCYAAGATPPPSSNNLVDVQQWVLWDGVEDRKYLQVGDIDYTLGSSYGVEIPGDAVVSTGDGDKTTFVAEQTASTPSTSTSPATRTARATYTFDKEGMTIEGTLALSATCVGTGCDRDRPNCEASLRFTGRQVDADQEVLLAVESGN
ncbi:hypothetical protein [Archangium sp.]|jgi:hypothetical protein|uniref:hypothetical protein n=1 Tax=Archangium sp. TaxID=1872627 RepID=UPI002ED850B5